MIVTDQRTDDIVERLRTVGPWFWEDRGAKSDEDLNQLIGTQDRFRALLFESGNPDEIVERMLMDAKLPRHLAVKHAMLLTDTSAELLDRVKDYLRQHSLQSLNISTFQGTWVYQISAVVAQRGRLNNTAIRNGSQSLHRDLLFIILFGAFAEELGFPTFARCRLGGLAGQEGALEEYFRRAYLVSSRQLRGGESVASGSRLQQGVISRLEQLLLGRVEFDRSPGNRLPVAVGQGQQHDAVYRIGPPGHPRCYVAVEVAFQETTNSVIERKARQAQNVRPTMQSQHYKMCFVVGGAGWFARPTALKRLIENSDMCVSPKELDRLADYVATL